MVGMILQFCLWTSACIDNYTLDLYIRYRERDGSIADGDVLTIGALGKKEEFR